MTTTTTTARRALSCAACGFATDDVWHYKACVPTSHWPRAMKDRKAAAMHQGEPVPVDPDREPERVKPRGLAEYRRLHPEARPLTTENIMVKESRTDKVTGTVSEWERPMGAREARDSHEACSRCGRPQIVPAMHLACVPVAQFGAAIVPEAATGPRDLLKRDAVTGTPRPQPVVHTTADVRTGARWYEGLAEAAPLEVDEDEMRDFVGVEAPVSAEGNEVRDRLVAEQEAGRAEREADPLVCPVCQRVSGSMLGSLSHQRSHARGSK
jgi:ribosomal protein L37E